MEDQYYDIERRIAIKEEARLFRRKFLTYEPIMKEEMSKKHRPKTISLTEKRLNYYFPKEYSTAKREKIIIELLTKWKEEQGDIK